MVLNAVSDYPLQAGSVNIRAGDRGGMSGWNQASTDVVKFTIMFQIKTFVSDCFRFIFDYYNQLSFINSIYCYAGCLLVLLSTQSFAIDELLAAF